MLFMHGLLSKFEEYRRTGAKTDFKHHITWTHGGGWYAGYNGACRSWGTSLGVLKCLRWAVADAAQLPMRRPRHPEHMTNVEIDGPRYLCPCATSQQLDEHLRLMREGWLVGSWARSDRIQNTP
jgi:hypothetical protein